jgi:hypothetical protein
MNRRSFLSRLAGTAAIIALAPRLAFRAPDAPIAAPVTGNTVGYLTVDEIVNESLRLFQLQVAQLREIASDFHAGSG